VIRWLLMGMLLAAPALAPAEDAALRAIEDCRARLDARSDLGIERIRQRCPGLLPALQQAPWRQLLPASLGERREDVSADSLRALAELVTQAADAGTRRAAPDPAALAPVLAELGEAGQQGATRWERFKRWLKDKFEGRSGPEEAGWLEKLRRELHTSEGVMKLITYAGYALILVLVLFVIWSELRALGLFGGTARASRRAAAAADWRRRLMLTDVFAAPLADRPGMLLRLLGEALVRSHRLPSADGLTASELARQARLDAEAERAALARVAGTAEQVRYAAERPADAVLEGTVEEARELLGRLAHARGVRR